jgi:Mg2+-importing ATPase
LELLRFAQLFNCLNLKSNICYNPLDQAIFDYATKTKQKKNTNGYKVIDDIAFDFKRRRMGVVVSNKQRLLIVKGASEEMLSVCSHLINNGKKEAIGPHLKAIRDKIKFQESQGFKTLLVASREIENKSKYGVCDEHGLALLGFLVFSDPPKKTARQSLDMFRELGVNIKLLTGDTAESAKFLAKETGFVATKTVLGSRLDCLSDAAFKKLVNEVDIFAKVTPEHKLKIVKALKESGHNVAFLGDGVNDAPALRAADVGISVDSATDVAKEAADVILLKKSLPVLIDGIKEGRRTFGNTIKYIFCTISSNYGNMFSVVGASIILPFIPLLPVQVLLLNFLSDFPMLAVSTDTVDEEYLKKPKHWDIKKIKKFMNYFGFASSAFDFLTYGFLLLIVHASMPLFQVGWFWQSFLTEVLLIFVVRTRKWFFQSRPSRGLVVAFVLTIAIVLGIMYTPLASYFGFARMPLWVNLCLVMLAFGYFIVVELGKKWFYKRYDI